MSYQLDASQWRAFRLFLISLDDRQFNRSDRQLRREIALREEYERDVARLFLTSLNAGDLRLALRTVRAERAARIEDQLGAEHPATPK